MRDDRTDARRLDPRAELPDLVARNQPAAPLIRVLRKNLQGYDLCSPEGYASTFKQFGRLVGFDRLKVFHLNDSKRPLGSRVDRHEHIGEGFLGLQPFRRIVNDRRFRGLPMLLETPKGECKATGPIAPDPLDERNLNTLRNLIQPRTRK